MTGSKPAESWTILEAKFIAGAASPSQLPPPSLAEVAFAGRSNVGKSSLLNRLVNRHGLVRTGSTPGTTRQLNFFQARASDGLELLLVDLPGYGYAKRGHAETRSWGTLIDGYLRGRVTLRALVLIVDVRRGIEPDDQSLIEFLRESEGKSARPAMPILIVATKLDKLASSARKPAIEHLARACGTRPIGFSATSGDGAEELWRKIRRALQVGADAGSQAGGDDGLDDPKKRGESP